MFKWYIFKMYRWYVEGPEPIQYCENIKPVVSRSRADFVDIDFRFPKRRNFLRVCVTGRQKFSITAVGDYLTKEKKKEAINKQIISTCNTLRRSAYPPTHIKSYTTRCARIEKNPPGFIAAGHGFFRIFSAFLPIICTHTKNNT